MARPIPKSNKHQVGGRHYKAEFQHWDWVAYVGLGYFEGQITRYVMRWQKKNGVEDVKKAIHYTEKLMELVGEIHVGNCVLRTKGTEDATKWFFKSSKVQDREQLICRAVLDWRTMEDLHVVHGLITNLLKDAQNANS